jgi:hypothetical protein
VTLDFFLYFQNAFGISVMRTEELEARVADDIGETLHLFNFIIPTFARGFYAFLLQVCFS